MARNSKEVSLFLCNPDYFWGLQLYFFEILTLTEAKEM